MTTQLEVIIRDEHDKTNRLLENLKEDLADIQGKEIKEISTGLCSLVQELGFIEKKEFSFMKTFGLEDNELVHSNVLAWLLDPLESHGLGSQFAEKFLFKVALKTSSFDIAHLDFKNLQVEKEISSEKSRLDIRIFESCGKFQCIIENKIWSSEGNDQTMRLYRDFHDETYKEELFVFLTLDKESKPKDPHFISLNYEEVSPILTELLNTADGDTRFLIKHYSNTLERLIMSEKFEGFSERTQLYYRYYKQIDEVKKAFDKDRKLLLTNLEEAIRKSSWWNKNWGTESTGGDISLWKNSWYVSEKEGIYFQLYMYITELGFAIRIYGEPSDFAAKFMPIFRKSVDEKYPGKRAGDFKKTFSTGVSKFIEKEIPFSPVEKNQVKIILEKLTEMLDLFDGIIETSLSSFKKE